MIYKSYNLILQNGRELPMMICIPEVTVENWLEKLDAVMNSMRAMNTAAIFLHGPINDRIGIESLIDGDSDIPVNNPDEVLEKINSIIGEYADPDRKRMYMSMYSKLFNETGTESAKRIANETFRFCSTILPYSMEFPKPL